MYITLVAKTPSRTSTVKPRYSVPFWAENKTTLYRGLRYIEIRYMEVFRIKIDQSTLYQNISKFEKRANIMKGN